MRRRAEWPSAAWRAAAFAMGLTLAGSASAQTAPTAQTTPAPMTQKLAPDGAGCNTLDRPASAGGASIVPEVAGQQKNWQPPGGEISFTVRSFAQIPPDGLVDVCFRWKRRGEHQDNYVIARPTHLDLTDSNRLLKVTVVVPVTLPKAPSRLGGDGEYAGLYLCRSPTCASWCSARIPTAALVAADVSHAIGVTTRSGLLLAA